MIGKLLRHLFPHLLLFLICLKETDPVSVDFCSSGYCNYGGTCVDGYGTYLCQCTDDFYGSNCQYCKRCYGSSAPKCFQGYCQSWVYTDGSTGEVVAINNTCYCNTGWTGALCDQQLDACASNPCTGMGSICYNYGYGYYCACPDGMGGSDCSLLDTTDYCELSSCYGGICVNASASSTYFCKCQADNGFPVNYGPQCLDLVPNRYCNYSFCLYGSCSISWNYNSSGTNYVQPYCYCSVGWTGAICDTPYDICASEMPCQNGGSCDPVWGSWLCTCPPGFADSNCTAPDVPTTTTTEAATTPSLPPPVTLAVTNETTTTIAATTTTIMTGPTPCVGLPCQCANISYGGSYYNGILCNLRDSGATCVDQADGTFTCTCTSNFTGQYCDMAANLGVMLSQLYGNLTQDEIDEIRSDLQQHPPKLQDLIPFITGPMQEDMRETLSWDYIDIFQDAAFERKVISFEKEFYRWNDVVLGNCFTFNHPNSSTQFLLRNAGRNGGLYVQLQVHSEDYPDWVDTSAITVFFHKNGEAIFAESSRSKVRAGTYTKFFIDQDDYHRLNHPYGVCANGISEVKSYYYTGIYTIDGCFRSCYQDLLMSNCGCMDPRYPFPSSKPSCDIPQMSCINNFNKKYGDDPAELPDCHCPQPCVYSQFEVTWASAPYLNEIYSCKLSSNVSACEASYKDTAKIEVNLRSLNRLSYVETPVMSFNIFLGNLGGILGVLCGISIVTFIEFTYLIIMVCSILAKG